MALMPVPGDHVATIVTSLEMRARPRARPLPASTLSLVRWPAPANEKYRALFRRVGTPWLWFSRLALGDDALRTILDDPGVEVFAVADRRGIEVGILELDFREATSCELSFFGLVPEMTGQGHGGWLMAQALAMAWRPGIACLRVHSRTLDHPAALGFYIRNGFTPVRRTIETFADPRLTGVLPADSAPQIPCLGASRR